VLLEERLAAGEAVTASWASVVHPSNPGAGDGIITEARDPLPHLMFENRDGKFRVSRAGRAVWGLPPSPIRSGSSQALNASQRVDRQADRHPLTQRGHCARTPNLSPSQTRWPHPGTYPCACQ
jgi:hypothetical protein